MNTKYENRSPKSERNPKSESRRLPFKPLAPEHFSRADSPARFGLWISPFFQVSRIRIWEFRMKTLLKTAMVLGFALSASAADPAVGRLPNGTYYLKDEVDFELKSEVASGLSPAGVNRRAVDKSRLIRLHRAARDIVSGHSSAERWLKGEELPARVTAIGEEVPKLARSLKMKLHPGEDAAQVVEELKQNPDVAWASLNRLHEPTLTPNDARWGDQWGPERIRAHDAWDVSQASTTERVAIIDTGVDLTHPDLASRIIYNRGFGSNGNGDCKRDRRGGSSIDHGTHVAGTAAAIRGNSIGIAGVVTARIMAMGCASWNSDENKYYICCAADAINDAVANGADAINCSFGNSELTSGERDALDNAQSAGVLVVAAAGNDGMNVDSSPSQGWNDHSWPIIVSNATSTDALSGSSNFGNAIDLAAPGSSILSTVSTNYSGANVNGNYSNFSGTSMASPHVAGAAVLVKSMNPTRLTGSGIKDCLYRMAEDLGSAGKDTSYGNGMLQLWPSFLSTLKSANAFVNPDNNFFFHTGAYLLPYNTIPSAIAGIPAGGTLVLNGGVDSSDYRYPAQTINSPVILRALPDRSVLIGKN